MPEHAELPGPPPSREFHLSEFQRSRYKAFAFLCAVGVAIGSALALSDFLSAQAVDFSWSLAGLIAAMALAGWCALLKADRPFARLTRHGLCVQDGLFLPWSTPWTGLYAIDAGRWQAELRLAGARARSVSLTMFEREDRKAFVEAVRKWIYSSH